MTLVMLALTSHVMGARRSREFRPLLRFTLTLLLASLAAPVVLAQSWPARPLKLIVPFPPGGTTDIMGRLVAQKLSEALSWTGLSGPAGLSRDVVARLNGEMHKAMQAPDVRERLTGLGLEPAPGSPDEMTAFVRNEVEKWGKVIKAAGAKVD